ncbi:hypothetical protein ACTXJG_13095 [Glutamicibacter arilaitensis]|uniref:hypothetical protein n=1 Tax=Glutamicibacter arilaitensis TaxID=256701 RepID=UPI003FD4C2A8
MIFGSRWPEAFDPIARVNGFRVVDVQQLDSSFCARHPGVHGVAICNPDGRTAILRSATAGERHGKGNQRPCRRKEIRMAFVVLAAGVLGVRAGAANAIPEQNSL